MKPLYVELDIDEIKTRLPVRQSFGDLANLEESIRKHGLLFPVIVDRNNVLIAGSRRLQACKNAGVVLVPAMRYPVEHTSMAALEVQVDENLCRLPLTPEELDQLINRKKSALSGRGGRGLRDLWNRLKNTFGIR